VAIAQRFGVPMHFRSVSLPDAGTMVVERAPHRDQVAVRAVAHQDRVAKIRVSGVPNRPGGSAEIFEALPKQGIHFYGIASIAGSALDLIVPEHELDPWLREIEPASRAVGATVTHDSDLATISIVGTGMQGRPGVAALMFRTITEVGANIDSIASSEIRVTCVVKRRRHEEAVCRLHSAFELDRARAPVE
jgi:aspartate kinase